MRLTILGPVIAGLLLQAGATNLHIEPVAPVAVPAIPKALPPIRMGHPVAAATAGVIAPGRGGPRRKKAPCMTRISNAFRKAVGLPTIDIDITIVEPLSDKVVKVTKGEFHILPFIGGPDKFHDGLPPADHSAPSADRVSILPHPHHHHGHHRQPFGNEGSFLRRVGFAISSLGPWEGRAVAFVLGCGIGVLIRMVWVLLVVFYRTTTAPIEEERSYEYQVVNDAEEIFVPPPVYVIDEKQEETK